MHMRINVAMVLMDGTNGLSLEIFKPNASGMR